MTINKWDKAQEQDEKKQAQQAHACSLTTPDLGMIVMVASTTHDGYKTPCLTTRRQTNVTGPHHTVPYLRVALERLKNQYMPRHNISLQHTNMKHTSVWPL